MTPKTTELAEKLRQIIEIEIESIKGDIRELPRKKILHGFRSEYYVHLPSTLGIIAKHCETLTHALENSAKPNEKGREE